MAHDVPFAGDQSPGGLNYLLVQRLPWDLGLNALILGGVYVFLSALSRQRL